MLISQLEVVRIGWLEGGYSELREEGVLSSPWARVVEDECRGSGCRVHCGGISISQNLGLIDVLL